jgi:hypothetical protein
MNAAVHVCVLEEIQERITDTQYGSPAVSDILGGYEGNSNFRV